jgi:hypothetical protein
MIVFKVTTYNLQTSLDLSSLKKTTVCKETIEHLNKMSFTLKNNSVESFIKTEK